MDDIDALVIEELNNEKDYEPKRQERRLPNGSRFYYNYNYQKYNLRNEYGILLNLFDKKTIDNMDNEEFVSFLVKCSKDNR